MLYTSGSMTNRLATRFCTFAVMLLTFSVFSAHLNFEISSGGCGGAVGLSYNIGTNPHPLNKKTVFSVVVVAPVAFVDDDDSVGEFT